MTVLVPLGLCVEAASDDFTNQRKSPLKMRKIVGEEGLTHTGPEHESSNQMSSQCWNETVRDQAPLVNNLHLLHVSVQCR